MMTKPLARSLALTACLIVGAVILARASQSERIPLRAPLSDLPMQLSGWQGIRAEDLTPDVLAVLGVDEWINRIYHKNAASPPLGLYIGYYASQRQGESMHSPLNCLPGSGWQPVASARQTIEMPGSAPIEVNQYIVQKNGENMVVLYWYQSHGRVIASEYWGKFYMVLDAIRMNRTDAALVRVVIPVGANTGDAERQAETVGADFVRAMFPLLGRHLPT